MTNVWNVRFILAPYLYIFCRSWNKNISMWPWTYITSVCKYGHCFHIFSGVNNYRICFTNVTQISSIYDIFTALFRRINKTGYYSYIDIIFLQVFYVSYTPKCSENYHILHISHCLGTEPDYVTNVGWLVCCSNHVSEVMR